MMARRKTGKSPVKWTHRPEGWKRKRWVKFKAKRNGKSGKWVTARGLIECEHSEYITNRNGKVLTDPDTGYLASTKCHKAARWLREQVTYLDLSDLGIAGMHHSYKYCDTHAPKHGLVTPTGQRRGVSADASA